MPVVVTGASGPVGRALIPRLLEAGSEVRAVVRRQADADPLRELGTKVAVGDAANPELLPAVLRDAHTLCHLVDGLFLDEDEYLPVIAGGAETLVERAKEAGLARILLLSYPRADSASPNAFLRAKGKAEEAVTGSGLEHAVVRSTLVLGRRAIWPTFLLAGTSRLPFASVVGSGSQRLAPAFVEDVAAVVAAADDRAQAVAGTFGLQGPDTLTADQFAALLGGSWLRRWKSQLSTGSARILGPRGRPRISDAAAEVLASDSLADAPDAAAEFGVKLTPLREALEASGFIAT